MEEEIWKDIPGYEGLYQVSSLGRVRSLDVVKENKMGRYRRFKGRILSLMNTKRGYQRIKLCKNGKIKIYLVHRLVAQAFIPNPEEKPQIDHIDTNPSNNRIDNLRWVTSKENHLNPLTRKRYSEAFKGEKCYWYGKFGNEHNLSKSIYQITKEGILIRKWEGMREAARNTEAKPCNITLCCQGKKRTSGGYRWIYADELDNFLIEKMKRAIEKRKRTAC